MFYFWLVAWHGIFSIFSLCKKKKCGVSQKRLKITKLDERENELSACDLTGARFRCTCADVTVERIFTFGISALSSRVKLNYPTNHHHSCICHMLTTPDVQIRIYHCSFRMLVTTL